MNLLWAGEGLRSAGMLVLVPGMLAPDGQGLGPEPAAWVPGAFLSAQAGLGLERDPWGQPPPLADELFACLGPGW